MNIRNQRFVFASDLFENLPLIQESWDEADHGSFDFSFGDCYRSMITINKFWQAACQAVDGDAEDCKSESEGDETNPYEKEITILENRLNSLDDDVLIDVEENKE